jgi:hypothetical protein
MSVASRILMSMTDSVLHRLQTEFSALVGTWSDALIEHAVPGSALGGSALATPHPSDADTGNVGGADPGARADERGGTATDGDAGTGTSTDGGFGGLSDAGLVRVVDQAGRVRRAVDAFLARAGDEVAKRSVPAFGADGLAKRHGFASPVKLVAAATGGASAEAARLVAVGAATREPESFTGGVRPAKFAHVRAGLDHGAVSLEAANLITGMPGRVEVRADPGLLDQVEEHLAEMAAREPLSLLSRAVKLAESRLDPGGVAPADEELYQGRSLSFREDANGVFHLGARLDPVSAAPVKAALDAMVSEALRRRAAEPNGYSDPRAGAPADELRDSIDGGSRARSEIREDAHSTTCVGGVAEARGSGPIVEHRRSIPQLQADAFAELARHVLGCASAPGVLPKTTVIVRMTLQALLDGLGTAEIDGIDRPVAAGTARCLAADAELIPAVFGTASLPLDLGRSARLFSRAQRLALAERDGGCASCGANITYADAHHIDWWTRDTGPTDLTNGVMLCSHCHHQVHNQGWRISVDDEQVWFTPPPHIDPGRIPQLGGRARFAPTRSSAA